MFYVGDIVGYIGPQASLKGMIGQVTSTSFTSNMGYEWTVNFGVAQVVCTSDDLALVKASPVTAQVATRFNVGDKVTPAGGGEQGTIVEIGVSMVRGCAIGKYMVRFSDTANFGSVGDFHGHELILVTPTQAPKANPCECGSHAIPHARHSTWCPIYV